MAIHKFICEGCGFSVTDTSTRGVHLCPKCKTEMYWDLSRSNITSDGDFKEFYSIEFGKCGKAAQEKYRKEHPGAEFGKNNGLKITSVKQIRELQRKTGMVNLCESREYREQYREGVERAKSEEHSKKK